MRKEFQASLVTEARQVHLGFKGLQVKKVPQVNQVNRYFPAVFRMLFFIMSISGSAW